MSVKLLTEHHLEFLSLKGGCTGLSKYHIVGNHLSGLNYVLFLINSKRLSNAIDE